MTNTFFNRFHKLFQTFESSNLTPEKIYDLLNKDIARNKEYYTFQDLVEEDLENERKDQLLKDECLGNLIYVKRKRLHNFHIVQTSPWPMFLAIALGLNFFNIYLYMHNILSDTNYYVAFFLMLFSIYGWFRDIHRESVYEIDTYNLTIQRGLSIGFIFFIVTELMFFFSFFWAFLHASLAPSIWIHLTWPPVGINVLDASKEPLTNTFILLFSGYTLSKAYNYIIVKLNADVYSFKHKQKVHALNVYKVAEKYLMLKFPKLNLVFVKWLYTFWYLAFEKREHIFMIYTLFLGYLFLKIQKHEYVNASFDISDGIFGSCFYMLTGFHGLHVMLGLIFLGVQYHRYSNEDFNPVFFSNRKTTLFGLQSAIWYWHFVDVVWLAVYIIVYIWGSKTNDLVLLDFFNRSEVIVESFFDGKY